MPPATTKTREKRQQLYEHAAARVITQLEQGTIPWRRPWGVYGMAKNFASGHHYTGINFFFLNFFAQYPIPYYLTYRQARQLGGNVRKGEKATERVYFYTGYYKDEKGNTISEAEAQQPQYQGKSLDHVRFLKAYPVFNIEQCEGIEWETPGLPERDATPIEECEAILHSMEPPPTFERIDANQAFYSPSKDIVNVPDPKQFESSAFFYAVVFHELAHWTGHETRLAREGIMTKGVERTSELYAEEELIAELASNYLLSVAGVHTRDTKDVSAAYLDTWIKRLKAEPNILFRIAPKAQAAAEYILGTSMTALAA